MPKPKMSDRFDKLIHTRSETTFFLILTGSIRGETASIYDENHGFGMRFTIRRNLTWKKPHRTVTQLLPVHIFSLYENNTLTWTILNRPTIVGLVDIQAALKASGDLNLSNSLPGI